MIDQQSEQQAASRFQRGPALWPFITSMVLMVGYFAFGYFVPVGPHCAAVFGDQSRAMAADLSGMQGGRYTTDWVGACTQAASAQAPLCWVLLALAAVAALVGLALRQGARIRPRASVPSAAVPQLAGELTQLAVLRDAGALSAEEYEAAKGKLLGTGDTRQGVRSDDTPGAPAV